MSLFLKYLIISISFFLNIHILYSQSKESDYYLDNAWNLILSENDSALIYIDKLKKLTENKDNSLLFVKTKEVEGLYYEIIKNDFKKASELYLEAIKICEKNKLDYTKNLYHTIGVMFHTTDEYNKAKTYYHKSLSAARKTNDDDLIAKCLINLGSINSSTGNFAEAEKLFEESLKYQSSFEGERDVYSNIGNLKIRQNKLTEAIMFLEKAIMANPETGQEGDILDFSYLLDAKSKLKDFDGIDSILKKSAELLKKTEYIRNRTIMLKSIGNAYEAIEDFAGAIVYKNLYIQTYDSLKMQQRDEIVYELEKKYQTEKKEEELQKRLKERNRLIVLSVLAGFIILVLCYLIYLNMRQKKKLGKQKIRLETLVEEKNTLLKETHHRVKNSFQIVSSLLYLQSESISDKEAALAVKEAQDRVKSMSLIHQKLYNKEHLTGIDTKEYIEDLIDDIIKNQSDNIQNLRVKKSIDSHILSIDTITPVGLIINELITNVIKHAFPDKTSNPELEISFMKKEDFFELKVYDNGIGISEPGNKNTFGLKLIHSLAKKLKAGIDFENTNGTKVTLLITKFEELNRK